MPIRGHFRSELTMDAMCIAEEFTIISEEGDAFSETSSSCDDISHSSFNSLEEMKEVTLKAIDAWIENPFSDQHTVASTSSRRRRRRRSSKSSPKKYDRVKTRYYALDDERDSQEVFGSQRLPKKTLEEKLRALPFKSL